MTALDHHVMAIGLLAYAAAAETRARFKVAARLRAEATAHVALSGGGAAELLGTRMPALGGVAA